METPPPTPSKVDLWSLRDEYNHIIKAHPGHFNALLALFLLPFSISLTLYPFLIIQLFSQSHRSSFQQNSPIFPNIKLLILNLLCILSITIFFLLATASITHSLFHGFYGRPIKLVSSIKAAFSSFFPLLSTCSVQLVILSGIGLILGLAFFSLIKATQFLGFHVNYSSSYFINILYLVCVTMLVCIVVYYQVNWIVAYVIVPVESSWGFEPLNRSKKLVKGMKGVAFRIVLFCDFLCWTNTWRSVMTSGGAAGVEWKSWPFICNIVATSFFYMLYMLINLAASTVLYIHAKAQHGETAEEEIVKREYVSLPSDDAKVPHDVSIL